MKDESKEWRLFRRQARFYRQELKRIRDATLVDASGLRRFASRALEIQKRRKANAKAVHAER